MTSKGDPSRAGDDDDLSVGDLVISTTSSQSPSWHTVFFVTWEPSFWNSVLDVLVCLCISPSSPRDQEELLEKELDCTPSRRSKNANWQLPMAKEAASAVKA